MKRYGIKGQRFDNCKEIMLIECESERLPISTQQGGYFTTFYSSKGLRDLDVINHIEYYGFKLVNKLS